MLCEEMEKFIIFFILQIKRELLWKIIFKSEFTLIFMITVISLKITFYCCILFLHLNYYKIFVLDKQNQYCHALRIVQALLPK